MHRTPQSFSTGALPGISKKGPFRKDGLHQSGNWVIAHKGPGISPGSTRGSWQVPSSPTEAMIASWPRWAIPGFLEQIPPRLEGCRQRLLAAEIELRRAEKAGGLEVGNASAPQEEAETKSVVQDLPILKAPEETTDEYADMPQEAVWILDQVGELEGQFTELNSKLQELEVSHATARKLKSQYAEDAGTCFAAMIELSSRVTALTEQLKASQGTAGALRGKLGQAIGNTQRLQKQVAEGHNVATRLKEQLASARAIAERYKGDWEAVTEDHTHLRAQHESLSNAKFVLEKDAAAHKGQLAKADANQVELRGELDRAEERIETLAAESKAKDASLRELQSALAAEKEASLNAVPPPPDPVALRAEAATVARMVVKDWLRTATPEPTPTEPAPAESTPVDFAAAEASSAELAELRAQLQDMLLAKEAASSEASSLRAQLEQEKEAALQLAEGAREKDAILAKLAEESREKDQTIQGLQEALELQKERARSQADASEDDLRKELAHAEEQLDELAKQGREKDTALLQLQETAETEKAEAKAKADESLKRAEEQLEQVAGENKEKDAFLQQLSADLEASKAKAQEDREQVVASQEELRGELSRVADELEQVSSQSREKDASIQQLQAAIEAEKANAHSHAEADAGHEQLSGEVLRLNAELEQAANAKKEQDATLQRLQAELDASAKNQSQADAQGEQMKSEIARLEDALAQATMENKDKDAATKRLEAALDAAQEASKAEKGTPDAAAAAVPDPRAVRADAEAVARLVVKDWLRTGSVAAAPPEVAPDPVPEPQAQEPKAAEPKAAESPAGPIQRMLQEQWLSEWPCGPKDLQMALVPASVLCSGVDNSLAEGQLAPTRLWLDAGSDELYLQPLLPSGPASKLKSTSVASITCTQDSAYDDDASLEVEIDGGGGKKNLKFFSDGEGIEMLLAALTRDTRVMPGQLMD